MAKLYFFADLTIFKKDFKEDMYLNQVANLRTINKSYNITWGKLRSNNLAKDYKIDHREETFKDENGVEYKGYYNAPVDCQMTIDSLKLVIDNYSYEYRGNGCAILEINVEPGFKTIQIEMKMTDHIHNPDILKYKLRYKKGKSIDECYEYKSDKRLVYLHKGNNFIIGNVSYQKEYLKLIQTQYVLSSTTEAFFAGDHPFNSQSCCKSSNVTIKIDQTNCNGFNKHFYNTNPNCVIVKPIMPKDDNIVIPGNCWQGTNNTINIFNSSLQLSIFKKENYSDGAWYEGDFKDGKWHGNGTYCWPDGGKYIGQFLNGLLHGEGVLYHTNGTSNKVTYNNGNCISIIPNNIREEYSDGAWYEGEMKNGVRHGQGTFGWPDGGRYVGQFSNGVLHGEGILYHVNGTSNKVIYENNELKSYLPNNIREEYPDGAWYEGEMKSGVRHGQGTFGWPGGNKYVGGWNDGSMHGDGIIYYNNGIKEKVVCNNGTYIHRHII